MAENIKKYKPTSPARRFMSVSAFNELTGDKPERSLLKSINKTVPFFDTRFRTW